MDHFGLKFKCSEKWDDMSPTERGAFCQSCQTEVIDFTNKSTLEIKKTFLEYSARKMCGSFHQHQIAAVNNDFQDWQFHSQKTMKRAMLISLIVVFGLSLFSCSNTSGQDAFNKARVAFSQVIAEEESSSLVIETVEGIKEERKGKREGVLKRHREKRRQKKEVALEHHKLHDLERRELIRHNGIPMGGSSGGGSAEKKKLFNAYLEDTLNLKVDDSLIVDEQIVLESTMQTEFEFDAIVYPNPVPQSTTLKVRLPFDQSKAIITLYSMSGSTLINREEYNLSEGENQFKLNLFDIPPAIYQLVIRTEDFSEVLQVVKQ